MNLNYACTFLLLTTLCANGQGVPHRAGPDRAESGHTTLDRIRARHAVSCGISKEEEDYSRATDHGNRAAFDIDFCKAVTVAVLGPGTPLVIKSYPDEPTLLKALLAGEIDLAATASPTVANTARGLLFSAPSLHDGQGFLLPNNPAVRSPADLAGKKVCFLTGSAAENGLHSYALRHGITYAWYPFSEAGEMEAAFFTGQCDAITSDATQLANIRSIDSRRREEFTILTQRIREEPLAAATLATDVRFTVIVNWVLQALVEAEELGVTQKNVRQMQASTQPELQQLLGQRYGTGSTLSLDPYWATAVIEAVGNYGEIFERDLGPRSPLGLDRGQNRLATQGGLMLALPLTER